MVLLLFLILLGLGMFFSAVETCLISLPRPLIQQRAQSKGIVGLAYQLWISDSNRMLVTILVGNTAIFILATTLAAYSSVNFANQHHLNHDLVGIICSILVTIIILTFGEILPKVIARTYGPKLSTVLIVPLYFFDRILKPFTWTINWIIRHLVPGFNSAVRGWVTEDDIKVIMEMGQQSGVIEEKENKMIQSIFRLGDTRLSEVIIPRTEMACIRIEDSLDQIFEKVNLTGYSRIPIYQNDLDHIVGILYTRDLISLWKNKELVILQDILRKPFFVPETMRADQLLEEFRRGKIHMAIVVDEYGGTAGLVTMEDLLEKIVGNIQDEYDVENDRSLLKQEDGSYLVEAQISLGEINDRLGIHLVSSGEVSSLGGYLIEKIGKVPRKGRVIQEPEATLKVMESDEKKVIQVRITLKKAGTDIPSSLDKKAGSATSLKTKEENKDQAGISQ